MLPALGKTPAVPYEINQMTQRPTPEIAQATMKRQRIGHQSQSADVAL